jgi:hypothetical protein
MLLILGMFGLSLAAVGYGVTLLGVRNPKAPGWSQDFLVANLYVPGIILFGCMGLAAVVQYAIEFEAATFRWYEPATALGIGILAVLLIRLLSIPEKIAAWEIDIGQRLGQVPLPLDPEPTLPQQPVNRKAA